MTEGQAITQASRSNLALAFVVLSRERRRDVSDFYAFCRIVDDIVDGDGTRGEKTLELELWRRALAGPCAGEPTLAAAQRALMQKYGVPLANYLEIISGVEMDLERRSYETWEELRVYCHRVASVVGLVSIRIFGARDPGAREYALNLGLALQITNILRDVREDLAEYGRVYLPAEEMERFGVTREDLAEGRRTEGFLALMDFLAERAEGFYRGAVRPRADRRALAPAEIMRGVYFKLLRKMKGDRWRVFEQRYRVGKWGKFWAVVRGWVGAW
jgi:15-cis-phytoene synthase